MNLLRTILTAPWMISEQSAQAYWPVVLRLMAGEDVQFQQEHDLRPYAFSASTMKKVRYRDFANAPQGSVAVYPVIGAITKYGGMCAKGTEDLMLEMSRADEMSNIAGHLLEIDSGGGEGTNMETVARFIRNNVKKPVIAWFNGTAASAAYYLASAADEIYASEETDMVGSIGVMFTMTDWRTYFEAKGVKIHEVYASQSTEKNKDIRDALNGDYSKLRADFLDPYAARFIATVQEMRPNLTEEKAYQGAVFMAPKAQEIGMIDGILSYEEAVSRVLSLGKSKEFIINQNNNLTMKRIQQVLGYELEMQDGGAFLNREELVKLDRHLLVDGTEAIDATTMEMITEKVSEMQERTDNLVASFSNIVERMEANEAEKNSLSEKIAELKAGLEAIGKSPAAGETRISKPQDNYQGKEQDPLTELDRIANEAAKDGSNLRYQ